jgi:uncharacterized protein (TIGR00725 family)
MRRPQVTVIGDSDCAAPIVALAEAVGDLLARLGVTVVSGGGGGVMEAASRGAARAGGLCVGILPSERLADANPWCSVVIPTGLGHARNAVTVLAGDLVVVIGGSAGTLSEIAFAWIHGRPILTVCGSGGWADAIGLRPIDARQTSTIRACADLAVLEAAVRELCAERGLPLADTAASPV